MWLENVIPLTFTRVIQGETQIESKRCSDRYLYLLQQREGERKSLCNEDFQHKNKEVLYIGKKKNKRDFKSTI